MTVPFSIIIGFIFFVLESIGYYIENPFENSINDIPMTSISRTIEINLRQQLGETELPEPVQPVEGFLY
jgi:ion channel-forming bestrophin family protein